ncbi:MAG TPA: ATP-binding protein [Candidatus Yonathbacteria bacterium]|nr:ATP-binding protein [Candidatus Yonathbacteria bacterium]
MKTSREDLIKVIDFWNTNIGSEELFGRELVEKINYKSKEVIDILGPRRSGKSSILKLIISRLGLGGDFLYINFEDPYFIKHNGPEVVEDLIDVFREHYGGNLKYLFFDEIQEVQYWEKAIRKLRDKGEYKIFVTGSSLSLLSREMSTALTGRHLSYMVLPLDFREFLFFKKISIDSKKDLVLKGRLISKKFDEYLSSGGFPEAVITGSQELLKEYFYDIIQKDIIARHQVRDKDALEKTAVFILSNSGKIVSVESIKDAFSLSFRSADLYVEYLKDAFLVFELSQFSFSLKKQTKALKKVYAVDTGLAWAVSFKFSEDKGRMLENLVYLHLRARESEIYYYRTKNRKEVDFFVKEKTNPKILIQVAWSLDGVEKRERELDGLMDAMNETGLKEGFILTYSEEETIKKDGKTVYIFPVYKWLLEDM